MIWFVGASKLGDMSSVPSAPGCKERTDPSEVCSDIHIHMHTHIHTHHTHTHTHTQRERERERDE